VPAFVQTVPRTRVRRRRFGTILTCAGSGSATTKEHTVSTGKQKSDRPAWVCVIICQTVAARRWSETSRANAYKETKMRKRSKGTSNQEAVALQPP